MEDTIKIDNLQFLETVFSGFDPERETPVVCAFPEAPEDRALSGRGWPSYHPLDNSIRRRVEHRAAENNTYFCISTVDPENKPLNRRGDSLRGTWVFPLDDIGLGEGAKYRPSTVPLEPSAIIETSRHNYQYLYFADEPVRDTAKAQALLTKMVEDHADTGASIAAKYIRLPVGWNSKATRWENDRPFNVELTGWHPERRYSVDQLMAAFNVSETDLAPARVRNSKASLRRLLGEQVSDSTLDPVLIWLQEHGLVVADEDSRGFTTIACPWAHEHTGGADTAGYSPRGAGGTYGDERQFKCLHDHCSHRRVDDLLAWVVDKGGPDVTDESLARFVERYVFIKAGELVFDRQLPGVKPLALRTFHAEHVNKFYYLPRNGKTPLKMMLSKEWQASKSRVTVNNIGFHPGKGRVYVDDKSGAALLNTYNDQKRPPRTDDTDRIGRILKHLQYLFGNDYHNALDWLAATVCIPERRLQYALLHVSINHGTGRGWLKRLIYAISPYVKTAKVRELTQEGGYNEWMMQSFLVMFDEAYERGNNRFNLADRMRELVTENRVAINEKWGFKGDMDVFANFFLMSNHIDAMNIPDKDRRLWCVLLEDQPQDPAYYRALYAMLDDETALNQFYCLLKRRAAEGKIEFAMAPVNETKKLVQNAGRDELSSMVQVILEELRGANVGVVWRGQLTALLRSAGVEIPADDNCSESKRIMAALREYGCVLSHGPCRPSAEFHKRFPGQKPIQRLLAISDVQHWHDIKQDAAKNEAERAALMKDLVPDPNQGARLRLV